MISELKHYVFHAISLARRNTGQSGWISDIPVWKDFPKQILLFPKFHAKRIPENHIVLKEPSDTDIRYRDETGEWVVGELAYDELNATGQMDSEAELYGRNRYYSDLFRVISRTGIALGFMDNDLKSYNDQKILYRQDFHRSIKIEIVNTWQMFSVEPISLN